MKKKKNTTKPTWTDPDDAPELTEEWFQKADLYHGKKLVRRGRPPKEAKKISLHLRVDPDIVRSFRASGPGWQTRINEALREWVSQHS